MNINERVAALRRWMRSRGISAYLIPTADPHNDEYIPAHWNCREWLTGFTGSAGLAVVTQTEAALWTDSRYFLQAADELSGTPFALMREGEDGVPAPGQWLQTKLRDNEVVGCPADMLTVDMADELIGLGLKVDTNGDAFNDLWTDRPTLPMGIIDVQDERYVGLSVSEKLSRVLELLGPEAQHRDYIFNDLGEIAWLLNLRGSDVPYNPVFVAYLVYFAESHRFVLMTHLETITPAARALLAEAGVSCVLYGSPLALIDRPKHYDFNTAPCLLRAKGDVHTPSPVAAMRAEKNEAELQGFRDAMTHDGVAMVQFLHWLDEAMQHDEAVTEVTVDERLTAFRAAQPGYSELSFATIAGYGPHGAIVHYEATPKTAARLEPRGLLLLDSGAQYNCGTTDITRTIALGPLTDEERRVYTAVLKGHLALSRLQFPLGTTGLQLDTAARADIWAEGYDFGHGTGHGVGSHLCVHEGPHQIRKNLRDCTLIPFRPGMVVTNEPGVYVEGRFGVRIENVLACVPSRTTAFGEFCAFETLTLCPYDLRPVCREMLTPVEVAQINAYHERVRSVLMPLIPSADTRQWLEAATAPLQ